MTEQKMSRTEELAPNTQSFLVTITCRGRKWPYKLIRDEMRRTISTVSGLAFEEISVMSEPDPYDFNDPDNLPERVV